MTMTTKVVYVYRTSDAWELLHNVFGPWKTQIVNTWDELGSVLASFTSKLSSERAKFASSPKESSTQSFSIRLVYRVSESRELQDGSLTTDDSSKTSINSSSFGTMTMRERNW